MKWRLKCLSLLLQVVRKKLPQTHEAHLEQSLHSVAVAVDDRFLRESIRHHLIAADEILEHNHAGEGVGVPRKGREGLALVGARQSGGHGVKQKKEGAGGFHNEMISVLV